MDGVLKSEKQTSSLFSSFNTNDFHTGIPNKRWAAECPRTPASLYLTILWSSTSILPKYMSLQKQNNTKLN